MGKKQYNSAADRRWQQRYQRILERKENTLDIATPRDERRRAKKTLYRTDQIDIEKLVPNKVAVLCTSQKQVRQLYWAVEKWRPEYTIWRSIGSLEDSFCFCDNAAVAIVTEDYAFFEETTIKIESRQYFDRKSFKVIDFCELLPVIDLGDIFQDELSLDLLFGD